MRIQQAEMAKEAGIEGFCYWHYWFAGRRLLDRVFDEVVKSGKPDYPFCLCWANHSWYQKTWDPNKPNKLLVEQTYPGIQDYEDHFYAMLPAFKDSRYIKVNGKLLFAVYAPLDIPDAKLFIDAWNRLAKENGLEGFYFVGHAFGVKNAKTILELGFDSVTVDYIYDAYDYHTSPLKIFLERAKRKFLRIPRLLDYEEYMDCALNECQLKSNIHPCLLPNFDHSPRSTFQGHILIGSTPDKWGELCKQMSYKMQTRVDQENLLFIKAWNEWGEGNYLEPDLKYGKRYIEMTKQSTL